MCLSSTELCVSKLIETHLYSAAKSGVRCVFIRLYTAEVYTYTHLCELDEHTKNLREPTQIGHCPLHGGSLKVTFADPLNLVEEFR